MDYAFAVATETLFIKIPREKRIRLQAIAKARKTKASTLVREALDQVLDQGRVGRTTDQLGAVQRSHGEPWRQRVGRSLYQSEVFGRLDHRFGF